MQQMLFLFFSLSEKKLIPKSEASGKSGSTKNKVKGVKKRPSEEA